MSMMTLERPLDPQLVNQPSPEIIRFLEGTAWGSRGLQYYVKHYGHALGRLPEPRFYTVSDSGRLVGSIMFFEKSVSVGDRRVRCVYLTQLSVRPEYRGRGLAGRLVGAVVHQAQSNSPAHDPVLVTAYIEEANGPSLVVFKKEDFRDIGRFYGTVINRVHPQSCTEAAPLDLKERALLLDLLMDLYRGHGLSDFEASLKTEEYRVIRDQSGQLLAGLQGHIEEWQVTQMEGLSGAFFVNVLGKIPWVKEHLFNPKSSRYVHIGNLYARPGHEKMLYRLVEDFLSRHRVPFAVGYFDKKSPLYRRFALSGSFGLLNAAMETPVRVMGWSRGLAAAEIADLERQPLLISPLDIS